MKIKITEKQLEKFKKLIDKLGINNLGIEPYKLIEMGLIKSLPDNYGEKHIVYENDMGGSFILNPCGSTYVYGNVPGVAGLSRLIQLVDQLKGKAKNQVEKNPKIALLHEQSASGTKQMIHILEK